MFICDPCLKKTYTNDPSITRSVGRCEMCRKTAECSEIAARFLIVKRSVTVERGLRDAGDWIEHALSGYEHADSNKTIEGIDRAIAKLNEVRVDVDAIGKRGGS